MKVNTRIDVKFVRSLQPGISIQSCFARYSGLNNTLKLQSWLLKYPRAGDVIPWVFKKPRPRLQL